ncbi:MAG: hypothetical protein WED87_04785, partial [Dehalococcoidia bacterium]
MAVGAQDAAAIEVVEERELLGQGVLVRRDFAPEEAELRLAVPLLDVAEELVVRAVFFDDVNDVLEDGALAVEERHGDRLGAGPRALQPQKGPLHAVVRVDALGVFGQLLVIRN